MLVRRYCRHVQGKPSPACATPRPVLQLGSKERGSSILAPPLPTTKIKAHQKISFTQGSHAPVAMRAKLALHRVNQTGLSIAVSAKLWHATSPDTSQRRNSGTVSGQFERSGDLRWNCALRNCTVLLAPRESWVGTRSAFVAAEAAIASTQFN